MSRPLSVFVPTDGNARGVAAAFAGRPGEWLPDGARHVGEDWLLALASGPISREIRVRLGEPWTVDDTTWRRIAWEPTEHEGDVGPVDRCLPTFEGELGLHHPTGGHASLVLDGTYEPPGSVLGELADVVVLNRVARACATGLLAEVAAGLRRASRSLAAARAG